MIIDESLRRMDSQASAVMILKVSSLLVGLLTTVLLARWLGPAGLGVYSFVLAVASVAVLPAHAGLATLSLRVTARGYAVKEWSLVRGFWRWSFMIAILVSLALSLLFLLVLFLFHDHLSPYEFWAAMWGIFLIPLLAINSLRAAIMRGIGEPVKGIALEALVKPGLLLFGVVGLAGLSYLHPGSAVGANLVATSVAVIAGSIWFYRLRAPETRVVKPTYASSEWWRSVLPLAFLVGAQQLIKYTDILFLGLLTSAADVGQYRIATQGASLITFVLVGVILVLGPRIAHLHALSDYETLQRLVIRASQWSMTAAVGAFLVILTLGEVLIRFVFGVDYIVAIQPLLVLAMGQMMVAFFGVAPILLTMTGNERISLRIFVSASLINIVLNLMLIPFFGMLGAAMSTSVALALAHASLSRAVSRSMGIRTIPVARVG